MDLKRGVLRLRRISAKQREVFAQNEPRRVSVIDPQVLPFFRDVHDHIVRVTDLGGELS